MIAPAPAASPRVDGLPKNIRKDSLNKSGDEHERIQRPV